MLVLPGGLRLIRQLWSGAELRYIPWCIPISLFSAMALVGDAFQHILERSLECRPR